MNVAAATISVIKSVKVIVDVEKSIVIYYHTHFETINIEYSYKAHSGKDTSMRVSMSGGVMIAAMSIMKIMACLRYFDI